MCDFQIFVKVIGKGSDPPGARTISFIQLIIKHLSNSSNLSPPISSEIGSMFTQIELLFYMPKIRFFLELQP